MKNNKNTVDPGLTPEQAAHMELRYAMNEQTKDLLKIASTVYQKQVLARQIYNSTLVGNEIANAVMEKFGWKKAPKISGDALTKTGLNVEIKNMENGVGGRQIILGIDNVPNHITHFLFVSFMPSMHICGYFLFDREKMIEHILENGAVCGQGAKVKPATKENLLYEKFDMRRNGKASWAKWAEYEVTEEYLMGI